VGVRRGAGRGRDIAAGLDDPVERRAVDDQVLDDREGLVVARSGPCGAPLITREHIPQMPSRQSWSNATGSSPSRMSRSFSTSSISRNDMSGEMSSTSYFTIEPLSDGPFWRQMRRVSFMVPGLTCTSAGSA
jgi:hypothetical protein